MSISRPILTQVKVGEARGGQSAFMTLDIPRPAPRRPFFTTTSAVDNVVLASLQDQWGEVVGGLRQTHLRAGEAVDVAGLVWFPTSAVLGLNLSDVDGAAVDVALVGRGGLAEAPASSSALWVVRVSGTAHAMSAELFAALRGRSPAFREALARAQQDWIEELQRAALCGRAHLQDGRFAGLLLRMADQSGRSELDLTQEQLAEMLGVQRTTVTSVATQLRRRGAIRYSRGRIIILDAEVLAQAACPCREAAAAPDGSRRLAS